MVWRYLVHCGFKHLHQEILSCETSFVLFFLSLLKGEHEHLSSACITCNGCMDFRRTISAYFLHEHRWQWWHFNEWKVSYLLRTIWFTVCSCSSLCTRLIRSAALLPLRLYAKQWNPPVSLMFCFSQDLWGGEKKKSKSSLFCWKKHFCNKDILSICAPWVRFITDVQASLRAFTHSADGESSRSFYV